MNDKLDSKNEIQTYLDIHGKRYKGLIVFAGILCALVVCAAPAVFAVDETCSTDTCSTATCSTDTSGTVETTGTVTTTETYTLSILDTNVAGDVTKNSEIYNNIEKTALANLIFGKVKQGSVVLQFGDGTGNKLMIWAGIHGNEEEANVATMRYLEYIKNLNFAGTLYVVPFAIPKDTAINSRYYGPTAYTYTAWVAYKKVKYKKWYKRWYRYKGKWRYKWRYKWSYKWFYKPVKKIGYKYEDPNRIANRAGTPGWNVVEFCRTKGIKYILDVHSGNYNNPNYAKGVIYATSSIIDQFDGAYPKEHYWAQYVKSKTGCRVEYGPGQDGMVRNQGHHYGINTITLEVERDGNTSYYANVALNMIKAACQYLGFPGLT